MKFGNDSIFAIQLEIIEKASGLFYGHVCYFINGNLVGDYSKLVSILDFQTEIYQAVHDHKKRESVAAFRMDRYAFYDWIRSVIYAGNKDWLDVDEPAAFDLAQNVPLNNLASIYLISHAGRARIIYGQKEEVHEVEVDYEEVIAVINATTGYLEKEIGAV